MLKNNLVLSLFILVLFSSVGFSQEITITKTAQNQIQYGDNLHVSILIINNLNRQIIASVKETIMAADVIEPQLIIPESNPDIKAAMPPYLEWRLAIDANSRANVSYIIKPNKIGTFIFSPTVVILDNGKTFFSDVISTEVLCNSNSVCETNIGENYVTCPNDCGSGSNDNICNPARDDICDSDCTKGVDLDCSQILLIDTNILLIIMTLIIIAAAVGIVIVRKKLPTKHDKTEKVEKGKKTKGKFCRKCDNKLERYEKYCRKCGTKR